MIGVITRPYIDLPALPLAIIYRGSMWSEGRLSFDLIQKIFSLWKHPLLHHISPNHQALLLLGQIQLNYVYSRHVPVMVKLMVYPLNSSEPYSSCQNYGFNFPTFCDQRPCRMLNAAWRNTDRQHQDQCQRWNKQQGKQKKDDLERH